MLTPFMRLVDLFRRLAYRLWQARRISVRLPELTTNHVWVSDKDNRRWLVQVEY